MHNNYIYMENQILFLFNRKKYLSIFWVKKVFVQWKKKHNLIFNWFYIVDYSREIL